jgi:plastocyanin
MRRRPKPELFLALLLLCAPLLRAQDNSGVDVRAQLSFSKPLEKRHTPAAVLWLKPLKDTPAASFVPSQSYTLLQKNRMFRPHLLVIPVGSVVQFPNADPFFHNVFSLFDGKKFDLGLYEAGSTKSVTFSREGVSYIFCNIHPEMSAVVLALSTSRFGIASSSGSFRVADVPAGEYEMHVWIEGIPQPVLNGMTRRVHLGSAAADLGKIEVPGGPPLTTSHQNMYGQSYDRETKPAY